MKGKHKNGTLNVEGKWHFEYGGEKQKWAL